MKDVKDKEIYNWDNEFSVRFRLNGDKQILKHIPNHIFMIELPQLDMKDIASDIVESESETKQVNGNDTEKYINLTLRSTRDKLLEKEVYSVLMNNTFNMEISLSNANIVEFEFLDCSVSKIFYTPLIHRNKSNYFNFGVKIKVNQIKIHNGDDTVVIGDGLVDYMSLVNKEKK